MTHLPNFRSLNSTLTQALNELDLQGRVDLSVRGDSLFIGLDIRSHDHGGTVERPDTSQLLNIMRQFGRRKALFLTSDEQPTKSGVRLAISFTPDFNFHEKNAVDVIDAATNDLVRTFESELKTRQTRRKRSEFTDPAKGPDAFVNRKKSSRVQVKVNMEPEDAARLNQFSQTFGMTKQQAVTDGLKLLYQARGFTLPEEDEPPTR